MGKDEDEKSYAGIVLFLVFLLIALVTFLALREGTIIEVVDEPTIGTIHTCSDFCQDECFSSLYDRVRSKLFVEGITTRCVCQCTNSVNVWLRGEPTPPEGFTD